jgi:hypothetical protein
MELVDEQQRKFTVLRSSTCTAAAKAHDACVELVQENMRARQRGGYRARAARKHTGP